MKRVAIIGCSHSDYLDNSKIDVNFGLWIPMLCERFPNIEFHNFSQGGHGHLYQDMVMKYLRFATSPYDMYIVQLTGMSRWMVPIKGTSTWWDQADMQGAFTTDRRNIKNYIKYSWLPPRLCNVGVELPRYNDLQEVYPQHMNQGKNTKIHLDLKELENDTGSFRNMAVFHSYLFLKELQFMDNGSMPIFYFTPRTYNHWEEERISDNNLNLKSFNKWIKEKYNKKIDDYLDETFHLTLEGNRILFEEYLMPSKLGKKLIDLSNN